MAKELLEWVKLWRDERGLTQEQFAEEAGMDPKHYQHVEAQRKTDFRMSTLAKLAKGCGMLPSELLQAVDTLNKAQRETLMLVVGSGLSYEEAAKVCGCPIGTIRSRLARARQELEAKMLGETPMPRSETSRETRLAELHH